MAPRRLASFPRRRPSGRSDEAVSEVLGSVILVVITVVMLGGFGALVLSVVSSETPSPPASSFTLSPVASASTLDVRLVSGSAIALEGSTLRLFVDGEDRTSSMAVLSPSQAGRWRAGETLQLSLSAPLAEGDELLFLAADNASGKAIGTAYATVATATSGTVILQNALTPVLAFDPASLVTDGKSVATVTLTVDSTMGLLLIDHVVLDLSDVGGDAALRLRDDGLAPDLVAGDGVFSATFSVANYTYDRLPGVADAPISATVVDILGQRVSVSSPTLTLVAPSESKVGAGVTYRNVGSSATITDSGYLNLSAFVLRDSASPASLDNDQAELRVSDLSGTLNVWSALVSFEDTVDCGPSVASVTLRVVDGPYVGFVTYQPAVGSCFVVGADARLNLADLSSSRDDTGATIAWTATGGDTANPERYQYAAAGITSQNEALIAFFGDTLSLAPADNGLSQTDFEWAPPDAAAPTVTPPSAPPTLSATKGNQSVALSWGLPASTGGGAITNYHVYASTISGATTYVGATGGANRSFTVNGLVNGQTYYFNVTAENSAGQGPTSPEASATPSTIPYPPAGFAATSGDARVTLSWTTSYDGGSALTGYQIYRGLSAGTTALLASTTGPTNTSFVDLTAANGVTYHYRVVALNANGASVSTPTDSATPSATQTVPAAPDALVATRGNNSVVLAWSAPSTDGGTAITTYKIYAGTSSGGTVYLGQTGGANTTFTVNGLPNGVVYFFNVTAVNAVGEGPTSAEASATPAGAPYPPTTLAGTAGNRSLSLSWSAPAIDGGLPITNYRLYLSTTSGSTTYVASTGGANTSFVVNGLTNGVTYFFNVAAENAVGEGTRSNEASAVPLAIPYPPASLVATAGDGQVSLSWSAHPDTGGSAITNYRIYQGTSAGSETLLASTGGANTTFVVNGLTNGQSYHYYVRAVNVVGESAPSLRASATPVALPGAPTALVATAANGSVVLSWAAPASSGGTPITNYYVYSGTSSSTTYLAAVGGTNTTFTVNGLTNGQTYFFNVTAVNAVGQGPTSAQTSATPSTVPNPPASLAATAGNASVSLSWSAGASGGSPITSYNLYRGTASGGATFLATIGTNTTFVDLTAQNGVTYYYNVTAWNANGQSATSNQASATPATIPHPPATLTATAGTGQVSLSWSAGSTGGSAITAYQVWRGTTSGGETLLATVGTNTTYVDANVAAGTTYYYQIRAVNAIGTSNPGVERSATPTSAAGTPTAPLNLNATTANNQVSLSWSAPTSDGGSAITAYQVWRGTSSGGETLLATIGTNTTYLDRTALNNVTYYYTVRAVNGAGTGTFSNEVSATPSASVSINCATFVSTAGTVTEGCTALQFGGPLANITETGAGGPNKEAILDFSMNVSGISGTQTLEIRGERGNAPENLLLQAYNPSTATYVTIVTLPSTATAQTTYSGSISMSTYASNGVLSLRIRDAGPDSNNSSWIVDFVRLVTT